ncbi:MAG: hypothetical protein ACRDGL_08705 [Candidatus Limnocylindrales bacterium]
MDAPIQLADPRLQARLSAVIDVEGKIPRALDELSSVRDRRVLLLDAAARGHLARALRDLGARLTTRRSMRLEGLTPASFDLLIVCWRGFDGDGPEMAALQGAAGVLAPGGRIVALQAYGRDDLTPLLADPGREARLVAWSHRLGPLLTSGWRVRTLHCWLSFGSLRGARGFLGAAFPATGPQVAAELRRPRLSFKVGLYHRSVGAAGPAAGQASSG